MFETLMKFGGHRVDYFNLAAQSSPDAFAFYVRGEKSCDMRYSAGARQHLIAGLHIIESQLGSENLVAVYVDVNSANNLERPAYKTMKADMRAGLFKRVFTFVACDLLGDHIAYEDLHTLYREVNGFEIFTYNTALSQPVLVQWDRMPPVLSGERNC
jgi:hypothetical protein